VLATLLAAVVVGSAGGAVQPSGPRLAVAARSAAGGEILTIGPEGEGRRRLAAESFVPGGGPSFDNPIWSPDGSQLALYGEAGETPAIYLMRADGSNLHLLRASEHPGGPDDATLPEPVFDPAGGAVIASVVHTPHGEGLFGDERPQTGAKEAVRREFWELPTDGGKARRLSSRTLTPKSAYVVYPSSVAPDGEVVATLLGRRGLSVALVDPGTGAIRVITKPTIRIEGLLEPMVSPDGSQIVYRLDDIKRNRHGAPEELLDSALRIVPISGGKSKRLVRVKGGLRWPSWDPSGSRISFTTLNAAGDPTWDGNPQGGNALMEINADGTCLTKVLTAGKDSVLHGAAWQPGAERGAGPISC
jgi:Tol biopolymer transport system component